MILKILHNSGFIYISNVEEVSAFGYSTKEFNNMYREDVYNHTLLSEHVPAYSNESGASRPKISLKLKDNFTKGSVFELWALFSDGHSNSYLVDSTVYLISEETGKTIERIA